jgi:vacuolar-type H+-ATPase subunit H
LFMAQDVLERIRDAEIQAEQIKAEARRQAEELLAQARSAASALVEEAKRHARDEGARLIATEESKARQEAEEIRRPGRSASRPNPKRRGEESERRRRVCAPARGDAAMSLARMQKVRLIGHESERERVLTVLQELGVLQIVDLTNKKEQSLSGLRPKTLPSQRRRDKAR